ncbi:MAG: hypothetical protein QX203_11840 [Methylococcaceae bacterium]
MNRAFQDNVQRFQIQLITKKYQNNGVAGVQASPALAGNNDDIG